MNHEQNTHYFPWLSRATVVGLAVILFPLESIIGQEGANERKSPPEQKPALPCIVETVPGCGATDVDPKLHEIRVTFDRDMQSGMSWTGGPPLMPPPDQSRNARWIDSRTCVLPVKLAAASMYRVGINSKSYQNFRSEDGKPAPPSVIAFTTRGAAKSLQQQVRAPKITGITPANGATGVKPSVHAIRVTFDMPMAGGMSWTGGGERFPEIPEGQKAKWSDDATTCTLPVELKPNWNYRLGLNSLSFNNFQSKFGIPLKPVVYQFSTSGQ